MTTNKIVKKLSKLSRTRIRAKRASEFVIILYYSVLFHIILYYSAIPYYSAIFCTIPYYSALFRTIPYYSVLFRITLYYSVLFRIIERHAKGSKMGGATSWWQHQNMVHSFLQLCSSYCSRQPSFFFSFINIKSLGTDSCINADSAFL